MIQKLRNLKLQEIQIMLLEFSYVMLFLKSFHFKFFWDIPNTFFLALCLFFLCGYIISYKKSININKIISILLLIAIIGMQVSVNNGNGFGGQIVQLICLICLIMLPDKNKVEIFTLIVKCMSIICLISLVGWILVCILNVQLPMQYSSMNQYVFYDYGIFNIRVEGVNFSRYLGMFIEPGHTGIMLTLCFICNGGDLNKWENKVIVVCTLFTLSLAAYILLIVYFLIREHSLKKSGKILIWGLLFLFIFVIVANYTGLGDVFSNYIVTRIERMITQNITGNRFSTQFNEFYNIHIKGDIYNYLFGVGSVEYNQFAIMSNFRSAGYKVYIAQNGIINTILVFLFYGLQMRIDKYSHNRKLYLIWILSFITIAYPTWACFLIFVICGPVNLVNNQNITMGATDQVLKQDEEQVYDYTDV